MTNTVNATTSSNCNSTICGIHTSQLFTKVRAELKPLSHFVTKSSRKLIRRSLNFISRVLVFYFWFSHLELMFITCECQFSLIWPIMNGFKRWGRCAMTFSRLVFDFIGNFKALPETHLSIVWQFTLSGRKNEILQWIWFKRLVTGL